MNGLAIRRVVGLCVVASAIGLVACKGGEKAPPAESTAMAPPAAPAAAAGALPEPQPGAPPAGATAAMVAQGDSIFHGLLAGGMCQTCHGADAKGTPMGPPLVKHQWITGDGSYDFIEKRVTTGMMTPTAPYTAPMPPMGGSQLTPDQIKAVAAYVYSISR